MLAFFRALFGTDFMPHLYCLRSDPGVLWLQVVSDLAIAAAYFAIPLVLLDVVRQRNDLLFRRVAVLFVLFIAACGLTHLLAVWTIWYPMYRLEGVVKALTAVFSVVTAIVLVRLCPLLQRLPSIADLESEIAERCRVETELRTREEGFHLLLESAPDAMVISNSAGLIELTNLQAERLFGYSRAEMIGQPVDILIPKNLQADYQRDAEGFFQGDGKRAMGTGLNLRARCKDGAEIPVEISFSPLEGRTGTSMMVAIRDITERRKSEMRFRALLESAPDAMVIMNGKGIIELVNAETERLFCYSREELTGRTLDVLIPEHLREAHRQHRVGYFQDPKPRQMGAGLDLWAQRKDGSLFPVEISLSPLEGPGGISVTAAIRDTTERRQAAKLLAEKVAELRHMNEELQQFAHIASHDLQEPLRMVASYTQLLANRYKGRLGADADEFIAYAVDGTKRMKGLIEDLLAYSRTGRSAAPPAEFVSEEALRSAVHNLGAAIHETGAQITHDCLPTITAVPSQVVQIFQNLLGNSIKYRGDRAPQIHVSAAIADREWIFSITDNGIGIDPKYFQRIFTIFQRLHGRDEYEGTGIGLAICKRILQQQGGRIWVESEPGHGSTFHFALPMR